MNDSKNFDLDSQIDVIDNEMQAENLAFTFLFRGLLRDFIAGAKALSEASVEEARFAQLTRGLCECSRELNFSAPSRNRMPKPLVDAISNVFQIVQQTIPDNASEEVLSHKRNIGFRSEEIIVEYNGASPSVL